MHKSAGEEERVALALPVKLSIHFIVTSVLCGTKTQLACCGCGCRLHEWEPPTISIHISCDVATVYTREAFWLNLNCSPPTIDWLWFIDYLSLVRSTHEWNKNNIPVTHLKSMTWFYCSCCPVDSWPHFHWTLRHCCQSDSRWQSSTPRDNCWGFRHSSCSWPS